MTSINYTEVPAEVHCDASREHGSHIDPANMVRQTARGICHRVSRCGEVWEGHPRKGKKYCGMSNMCFMCSGYRKKSKGRQLLKDITSTQQSGGTVLLVTLNPRHTKKTVLTDGINRASAMKAAGLRRSVVDKLRDKYRYSHRWQILEVAHTKQGWAAHFHIVLFFDAHLDKTLRNEIRTLLREAAGVPAQGKEAKEFDLRKVKRKNPKRLVKYLFKGSMHTAMKIARNSNWSTSQRRWLIRELFKSLYGKEVVRRVPPPKKK